MKTKIKAFFQRHQKIWGFALALSISVLIYIFRDKFIHLQGYGLFGLFVLSILGNATIILPAPVILTAFVGGAVFNPLLVAVVVAAGAAIGELTGYLGGYGTEDILEKDLRLTKVKKWMEKYGLWTLFFLAAVPNPLFDLAGIVAGATGVPVKKYLVVVFLGKLIKFAVFAYLGANSVTFIDKFL